MSPDDERWANFALGFLLGGAAVFTLLGILHDYILGVGVP